MKNETRTESAEADFKARQRELVCNVARSYRACRELPVICAMNHDPNPVTQSRKWTTNTCHFVIDVERALNFATTGKRDAPALLEAWQQLQLPGDVIDKAAERLIRYLAPVLDRRGLHPRAYFRMNRYPRRATA